MTGGRSAPGGFFANPDFDYEARIVLGAAAGGIGDVGLVLATLDRIADSDPQSWFDAWTLVAADLAARGDDALGRGHLQTASWAFLAAAEYYAKALMFVDGLADPSVLLPTFRKGRDCWEKVIDASAGRFVRVDVPYEGTTLPGYLLRPDATGAARPTLVVTNGSDGSLPGLLGYGGNEALARGWNVFVFDGPGQQSMLFERGVPFRYDWEAVLTPVINYLVAAVADPGVVDVSAEWTAHLPEAPLQLLDSGQKDAFNAAMTQAAAGASSEAARALAPHRLLRAGPVPAARRHRRLIPVLPFTEQFARETTPQAYWSSPTFKKINRTLSVGWGAAIFAIGVCRVAAAAINGHTTRRLPELLLGLAVPGVIVLYMLKFSKSYPDRVAHEPAHAPAGR